MSLISDILFVCFTFSWLLDLTSGISREGFSWGNYPREGVNIELIQRCYVVLGYRNKASAIFLEYFRVLCSNSQGVLYRSSQVQVDPKNYVDMHFFKQLQQEET